MFFCLSSNNWTTPLTVKDAYESWSLWKVDKAIKKIWIMIPACIFWCIWLERNKRCFDGESTALGILKTRCTENLFSWTNLYATVNAEQLQDFTNSLALAHEAYPYGTTVDDIDAGAKIPRGCMSFHVPSESFDVENILCSKGFSGTRPSIWAFQGLPVVNLESFKDILSTVSNLAMKGCLFLGELPVWLAEMDVGDHVGDLSAIKKWLDDLFMSYGFRVKMIEYDEVARNLRQDSAKRVSEVSTSILFVAEHLRFSDDQMETWRTEFQRIEEEGDEEGFEEL
ncbi:hypothetical protein H5410_034769 [Solanum commersonii]|uniref:Uncharacterized protein n=1 Tax=Solanum commersonii TaxID=4109 RepID=A0A9J5YUB8_SOLCO|nr:hypothetical protein H5410_034769 [Solanum commersonii]